MSKLATTDAMVAPVARPGLFSSFGGKARRNLLIVIPAAMLILMALVAIFAPYLGTVDPADLNPAESG